MKSIPAFASAILILLVAVCAGCSEKQTEDTAITQKPADKIPEKDRAITSTTPTASSRGEQVPDSVGAEQKRSSIDSNAAYAMAEASKLFEKHWRLCGNLYVTREHYPSGSVLGVFKMRLESPVDIYTEKSGVTVGVEVAALSEADRLNGWEWRGHVVFRAKAQRFYFSRGDINYRLQLHGGAEKAEKAGWMPWSSDDAPWYFDCEKINGTWQITGGTGTGNWKEDCEAVDCDKIPQ